MTSRPGALTPSPLGYVATPADGSGSPVLIVHSWWGLTASFERFADQLAANGHLAGCVDLFGGQIASTEQEARRLRTVRRVEPAYQLCRRSLDELAGHPRADGSAPAVVGFSMGGHWAVWLAQHPPPCVARVVLYYAARGGDFAAASTPVLAHFADHDTFVSTSARRTMERAIARRGLAYEAFEYPGTGHWFAESDHRAFDRVAASAAYERTVSFLAAGTTLGAEPNSTGRPQRN